MYLTKIELDTRQRPARMALGDCQAMHRLLNGLFDCPRGEAQLLYRVRDEGPACSVYLYSALPVIPEKLLPFMTLAGQRDISGWVRSMQANKRLPFDIIASPSKKTPQQGSKNSRRRLLRTPEERMAWLARKANENGFRLLQAEELEAASFSGVHGGDKGGKMYWSAYHYRGILQITDESLFQKTLANGLGPGKAYGLGMILLG